MKDILKILGILILFVVVLISLGYAFGWIEVHQTQTIRKAQQNANREVYEQTNSFVKGKQQEAIKYLKEYNEAETIEEKQAIEKIVSMSFADFDEDIYIDSSELRNWIKKCKY